MAGLREHAMNIHKICSAAAVAVTLGLAGVTPAFAKTATTVAPATTKAAAPATTATKAATPATKAAAVGATTSKPVVVGNFCKKKLVGTKSKNAAGVALTCKADAKGQPRWTK